MNSGGLAWATVWAVWVTVPLTEMMSKEGEAGIKGEGMRSALDIVGPGTYDIVK